MRVPAFASILKQRMMTMLPSFLLVFSLLLVVPSQSVPSQSVRNIPSPSVRNRGPIKVKKNPDDVVIYGMTRGYLEEVFLLPKGSLTIRSDGEEFVRYERNNYWTPYARTAIQKVRTEQYFGAFDARVETFNDVTVWNYLQTGEYHHEIYVDNKDGNVGEAYVVLAYVGPGEKLTCAVRNVIEAPSIDEILSGKVLCSALIKQTFDDRTCDYARPGEIMTYTVESPNRPYDSQWPYKGFGLKVFVAFENVDVFAPTTPSGGQWNDWVLENRTKFFDPENVPSPTCREVINNYRANGHHKKPKASKNKRYKR